MYTQMNQVQQNLNQIAQICNQISQLEQQNVSRLQQAAHLAQQTMSQMNQFGSASQTSNIGQSYLNPWAGGYQGTTSNWANIPVNTNQFAHTTGQYAGTTSY